MGNKALFIFMYTTVVLACTFPAHAQKTSESDLKKQAEKLFANKEFMAAASLYSELVSVDAKNPDYNYKYGACAIYAEKDKSKSLKYLEFASKATGIDEEVFYYLGKSYHLNYRFDEAIAAFEKYKTLARAADIERNNVNRLIEMCNNGKKVYTESVTLDVVEQKEYSASGLFSGYELSSLGGKILTTPMEFKSKIDKKKQEINTIYLSKESLTVYYSSYGENENNGKDIYKIIQLPSMEWSKPENLGPVINSRFKEDYPFIHADGKTLYFCSEGHNSMGGLDIFKSEYNVDTHTWSEPENMGYPINSTGDDIFFATGSAEPEFAYFASDRESVSGQLVVYKIRVKKALPSYTTIKGQFVSVDQPNLKSVKISIFNLENNELLGTYSSNPTSADYLIKVMPGTRYNFVVEAEGYLAHSENITISSPSEFMTMRQEIKLKKDTTGEEMIVKSYFEPKAGSETTAENIKPEEVSSKFKYDLDYKDKLKPIEIDGQIIFVTPPTTGATTTPVASASGEPDVEKSDFKGDISNNDIMKIAYDDAKETESEAISLKKDAEIASDIAVQRDSLAKAKGQESQLIVANAQKISNQGEKQQELNRAKDLEEEANKMAKEAEMASQMAKRLEDEAQLKQQESDTAFANAKALDASVLNNDKAGNLALSNKIKHKKSSAKKPKSGNVNDKTLLKKREAESELAYSERLNKESDSLMLQSASMKEKATNTRNSKERAGILQQSADIENTALSMQKSARQCLTVAHQIQDSVKTSEISSSIAKEVEQSNGKKDDTTPLISIASNPEATVPPVSRDTAKAVVAIVPNKEPKAELSNTTISQPVKKTKVATKQLSSSDSIAQIGIVKQKESNDLVSKTPKTSAEPVAISNPVSTPEPQRIDNSGASPATPVTAKKTKDLPTDKIETINIRTIKTDTTNKVNASVTSNVKTTATAEASNIDTSRLDKFDPNYSKFSAYLAEAKNKKMLADEAAVSATLNSKEANADAEESIKTRVAAEKTRSKKDKKLQVAKADALTVRSTRKQAVADSLTTISNNLAQESRLKQQEANTILPSIALVPVAPVVTKKDSALSTVAINTNPTASDISTKKARISTNSPIVTVNKPNTPAPENPVTANTTKASTTDTAKAVSVNSPDIKTALTEPKTKEMEVITPIPELKNTISPIPPTPIPDNPIAPVINPVVNPVTVESSAKAKSVFVSSSQTIYNDKNPIPLDVPLPEGLIFKVQIGAFKNPIPQNTFGGIQPITGEKTANGLTRYTAGLFISFETSNLVKKEIRSLGYKDAFIVAFYNGKRIPIFEAAGVVKKYSNAQKQARKNAIKEEMLVLKSINIYPEKYNNQTDDGNLAVNNQTGVSTTNNESASNVEIPTQSLKYDGLIYTVQIGVYRSANLPRKFKNMRPINRDQLPNGLYRYTSGVYNYFGPADSAKNTITGNIPDAFVITLFKGQAITALEGKRLEKTITPVKIENQASAGNTNATTVQATGVTFKVQLGTFRSKVPFDMVDMYMKIQDKQLSNKTNNGLTTFYAGSFKDLDAAQKLKREVVELGLKDAFLVAFDGDKQISIEEAKGLLNR